MKVYVMNTAEVDEVPFDEAKRKECIMLNAEKQDSVYTLSEFEELVNDNENFLNNCYITFAEIHRSGKDLEDWNAKVAAL